MPSAVQLFQNTAAALPAEVGPDGKYEMKQRRRQFRMLNPTRAALAWHKRLTAVKQRAEVRALDVSVPCLWSVQAIPSRTVFWAPNEPTGSSLYCHSLVKCRDGRHLVSAIHTILRLSEGSISTMQVRSILTDAQLASGC